MQEQEGQDAVTQVYRNGTYSDSKYYITTIGVSFNGTVAVAKIKQDDDSPRKPKLEPEHKLFSPPLVLLGCTKCYMYMMLPKNYSRCFKCHRSVHTLEELENM
jgi:hypothetical protein